MMIKTLQIQDYETIHLLPYVYYAKFWMHLEFNFVYDTMVEISFYLSQEIGSLVPK